MSTRGRGALRTSVAVARSAHLLPGVAVTLLATSLALTSEVPPTTAVVLAVAVFSGQLVVGWSNDLIDRGRDRSVCRTDKPLTADDATARVVLASTVVAGAVCVVASLACGLVPGLIHLIVGVGSGLAYNAGVKGTVFSPVPYLIAFGAIPVVVMLAADSAQLPEAWLVVVAGVLGVGAHLLNVFPDLDDDAVTGVRGLPHRLGRRRIPAVAGVLLIGATVVCVVAIGPVWWTWTALAVVVVLIATTTRAPGRLPFHAAIVVAGIDLTLVVFAG